VYLIGDAIVDLVVYNRSNVQWNVLKSASSYTRTINMTWGGAVYLPFPGDYDGDGQIDVATFQRSTGTWSVLRSSTGYTASLTVSGFGANTDSPVTAAIPVPGDDTARASDVDGDGRADITVYSASGSWLT